MNNNQARPMSSQEKAIQDFMHRCLVMRKEERIIDPILAELGSTTRRTGYPSLK